MIEQIPASNSDAGESTPFPFEDTVIYLPNRLRIHQRMGHMPPRFQREVGPQVETELLKGRDRKRAITAGELVTKLSTIIATSTLGRETSHDPEVAPASNEAVQRYLPKVLKQLVDDPRQRNATQFVYDQARLEEAFGS
jgi:hypothetical protein